VWLIVAIGATFAAFPGWYAALLSAAYLPLTLFLIALIGRGVAFDYRGKVESDRWRKAWDTVIIAGSWTATLCVGLLISTTVLGLPIDANGDRVGSVFAAVRLDTIVGALAFAGYALVHGAVFTALKTEGEIRERARRVALMLAPVALLPLIALLAIVAGLWAGLVVLVLVAAMWRLAADRDGQSFALMGLAIAASVAILFGSLYPNVLPSTLNDAWSLTVANTASSPYTLQVITWVAGFGTPAVLVYQGWTYWVFRKRISVQHIPVH
jgi:cytochrome d ubiquinol oxidase subunit II